MTRRRTSPAQAAPQTLDAAIALLTRYNRLAHLAAQLELERSDAKAQIDAEADLAITPVEAELGEIVRQLKPWWAVARDELTGGVRKSIELAGCLIGHRLSNPAVSWNGTIPKRNSAEEKAAILTLLRVGRDDLVRLRQELDKPAILTAFADRDIVDEGRPTGAALGSLGFGVRQREEFFVDAIPVKPAPALPVADAGEGA